MQTLFRGGRVIYPVSDFDGYADVLVSEGVVAAVGTGVDDHRRGEGNWGRRSAYRQILAAR
jgi:hypothetical protein